MKRSHWRGSSEGDVGITKACVELDWMNVLLYSDELQLWNRRVLAWFIEFRGYGQRRADHKVV